MPRRLQPQLHPRAAERFWPQSSSHHWGWASHLTRAGMEGLIHKKLTGAPHVQVGRSRCCCREAEAKGVK